MRRLYLWFLAYFRLSGRAICEMSKGRPMYADFHRWDDAGESPMYFVPLRCHRCGREFYKTGSLA